MQCAKTGLISGARRGLGKGLLDTTWSQGTRRNFLPFINQIKYNSNHCKSEEEREKKGVSCRRPDLRMKPIPPYKYGFCREPDPVRKMSCPLKGKKRDKGPCCHDDGGKKKGGCRVNK